MSESNKSTEIVKQESNLPNNQQMETMHYRPNEANFSYNGITVNIDIPTALGKLKDLRNKRLEKKALKELKKLENKTMTDVQHHDVVYEEVENEDIVEEDN